MLKIILLISLNIVIMAEQNLTQSINNLESQIQDIRKTINFKQDINAPTSFNKEKIQQLKQNLEPLKREYQDNIFYDGENTTFGQAVNAIEKLPQQSFKKMPEEKHINTIPIDRIYIFMSSSVPIEVWDMYAEYIDEYKIHNATLLLKGCIGSCEKIKPTLEFISKVVTQNGKNKEGLKARIQIDPLLFKKYNIDEAPCFVYAQNIKPISFELSEGIDENLQQQAGVTFYKSCGDWSFKYHIEQLEKMSKSRQIQTILKQIK